MTYYLGRMGVAVMEYVIAVLIGGGIASAALAWGWREGKAHEPAPLPVRLDRTTPTIVYEAAPKTPVAIRHYRPRPVSAASAASAKLDAVVAAHRERLASQNGIRSPRQS